MPTAFTTPAPKTTTNRRTERSRVGRIAPILLVVSALGACTPEPPRAAAGESRPHQGPLTDYVVAPGLTSLFVADLAALRGHPSGRALLASVAPSSSVVEVSRELGVDLARVRTVAAVSYPLGTVYLAETRGGEAELERRFVDRMGDRSRSESPHPRVHVSEAVVDGYPETFVAIDDLLVAHGRGDPALTRAVALTALGRLERVPRALGGAALSRLPADVAGAPLRLYVAGPFTDDAVRRGGGLLAASEAAAVVAWVRKDRVVVQVVLAGAWEEGDVAHAEHAWAKLAGSPLGALLGFSEAQPTFRIDGRGSWLRVAEEIPLGSVLTGVSALLHGDLGGPPDELAPAERRVGDGGVVDREH